MHAPPRVLDWQKPVDAVTITRSVIYAQYFNSLRRIDAYMRQ